MNILQKIKRENVDIWRSCRRKFPKWQKRHLYTLSLALKCEYRYTFYHYNPSMWEKSSV